jgi:predicted nucleic acid-binding protein
MTKCVYLDASFWVTYRSEDEARHPDAKRTVSSLFRERVLFVTTLPVICEIHAAFSRNPQKRALILEDLWNNPLVKIQDVSHEDQKAAIEILQANGDKTYSLSDAISFAIMRRLNIHRAVSFDKHFRQFGEFEIIP